MNIYAELRDKITSLAATHYPLADASKIDAMPPKDASHGDIATNAAMVLAAQVGQKPREIAEILVASLAQLPEVEKTDIAGAGFINLTLAPSVWQQQVGVILSAGRGYGNSKMGAGEKVNVEYVSANPTGPMHVGHGRGAVVGDALARLLAKAGYDVTREYYINDGGAQIDKLADSVFLRYRQVCGETIGEIPEGLYPGDYLIGVGESLYRQQGKTLLDKPREEWLPLVRLFAVEANMEMIRDDLAVLGIRHDVFTSERQIIEAGKAQEAIDLLESQGHLYQGVLEPPKGKPVPEDWEPVEQLLFRTTAFGDDADRPIKKSDGTWAYITPDIAYHLYKFQRGFDKMILVVGADHAGYQKRLQAAVSALSGGKANLKVLLSQMVKFLRNGEPAKMSKRAGTFVTVREVVEEVGSGVFRFIMLTRKNDAPLDFDFTKVMEQSKDNPVFYVQYAHARCCSIIRNAEADFAESLPLSEMPAGDILSLLTHPADLALIRLLASWPRMVEQAASAYEPHRIAYYLYDVASAFHALWNLGNDELDLRFLQKDAIEKTAARIALTRAVSEVIASGLLVMGVTPMEEMR